MQWIQRQRPVFALLIFVGLIGGWRFWVYWNGPYRAFRVIVSAMERKGHVLCFPAFRTM